MKHLIHVCMLFTSALLCIVLAEIIFFFINTLSKNKTNLYDPAGKIYNLTTYDPLLGYDGSPNVSREFGGAVVTLNAQGNRGPNYPFQKIPDHKRIIVLGDSQALGFGLPDDQTIPVMLEHLLAKNEPPIYEVVNLGVDGYGTDQEVLKYLIKGQAYSPDHVVLIYFHENDLQEIQADHYWGVDKPKFVFSDNNLCLTNIPVKRMADWPNNTIVDASTFELTIPLVGLKFSAQNSQILKFLSTHELLSLWFHSYTMREEIRALKQYFPCIMKQNQPDNKPIPLIIGLIKKLNTIVLENHADFRVVTIPTVNDYDRGFGDTDYQNILSLLAQSHIQVLDMLAEGINKKIPTDKFFENQSSHLSSIGNSIVTQALMKRITKSIK